MSDLDTSSPQPPAGSTPWVELSEGLLTDFRAEALENIELCEKALIDLSKTRGDPGAHQGLCSGASIR